MINFVKYRGITIGSGCPLTLIAGPCVLENYDIAFEIALFLKKLTKKFEIPLIFKASYDKANRTSVNSYRGPGIGVGLEILGTLKRDLNIVTLSDVHKISELEAAGEVLDFIQIPAFLCRQTDLIVEAAKIQKPINIKKGQFLSPWDINHIVEKVVSAGNKQVMITERGTMFGYNNLVVDFRGIEIIKNAGFPVIFDATHSVQLPGGAGAISGGQREFVPVLAKAAVAAGVDGIFIEVYKNPDKALCDGPNSIRLDSLPKLLYDLTKIKKSLTDG